MDVLEAMTKFLVWIAFLAVVEGKQNMTYIHC